MVTYEEIRNKINENKEKIVLAICFMLIFLVGFGTGRYDKALRRDKIKSQNYYSTKESVQPPKQEGGEGQVAAAQVQQNASSSVSCLIKGNISSKGKKIYHLPGGAFYERTNPEQCFATEAQAQAAGFVKSSR